MLALFDIRSSHTVNAIVRSLCKSTRTATGRPLSYRSSRRKAAIRREPDVSDWLRRRPE